MRIDTVILDSERTLKKLVIANNELDQEIRFTWSGAWSATTPYTPGNVVSDGGFKWLSISTNLNVTPVEGTDWTKL